MKAGTCTYGIGVTTAEELNNESFMINNVAIQFTCGILSQILPLLTFLLCIQYLSFGVGSVIHKEIWNVEASTYFTACLGKLVVYACIIAILIVLITLFCLNLVYFITKLDYNLHN